MMKYLLGAVLMLAGAGCVTNHQAVMKAPPAQPAPPPPPPVTARQVNNENAHAISQALWDEMDRDSQRPPVAEAVPATSPMKK